MFKSFFFFLATLIFAGNFFLKNSLIILLLFLEILVLGVVYLILTSTHNVLSAFNLSIIFMVFGVIAATLGLTLLSSVFKSEESFNIKSNLI